MSSFELTKEDHILYQKIVNFHKKNNITNHPDTGSALKTALLGADKLQQQLS